MKRKRRQTIDFGNDLPRGGIFISAVGNIFHGDRACLQTRPAASGISYSNERKKEKNFPADHWVW